ncbi:MAG TPA: hypothetical protein PK777_14065 [Thermoguttaceae bacterium]|nr:hypothetical protein [Thermoguttaceae bacterium]
MSSVQTTATWTRPASVFPEVHFLVGRLIGWGLLGSLCFGTGLLAYRRLAGALVQPLEPPWLAAVGLGAWLLAFLARWSWQLFSADPLLSLWKSGGGQEEDGPSARFGDQRIGRQTEGQTSPSGRLNWLTKGCLVGIALCLTVPGASAVGLFGLWGTVLGGWAVEGWLRGRLHPGLPKHKRMFMFSPNEAPPVAGFPGATLRRSNLPQPDLEHWPEGLLEQLIRTRTPDGVEVRSGWVRVDFLPGQRTAIVHIAFCPPFAHQPSLHLEQTGGPLVRVKTTHLYPYGVRIEVKRGPMDLERSAWALLEFQAQCPAASEAPPPPAPFKPTSP